MRTFYYFMAILIAPILAVLFYMNFHQLEFSNNQIDWGAFGSFVGGVSAPAVAAITLVFFINSNQEQARQTSLKVCIELIKDHSMLVSNYKLPNVETDQWKGRKSLKTLWTDLTNNDDQNSEKFVNNLKSYEVELEPIVSNLKYIFHYISTDTFLNSTDKIKMVQLFISRCERLELKLIKVLTLRDEELKKLVFQHNISVVMNLNPKEKNLMEYVESKWV